MKAEALDTPIVRRKLGLGYNFNAGWSDWDVDKGDRATASTTTTLGGFGFDK